MNTNRHEWVGRALVLLALLCLTGNALAQRERILINDGWFFAKGDAPGVGSSLTYTNLRPWILPTANAFTLTNFFARPSVEPALDIAFAQPEFDDAGWRKLNLPHDWGIEGPFKQEYPGETGKLPWSGVAWYRKHFTLPASDAGRRIVLEVDGAMSYASVWLNGKLVGGWPYGYSSWQLDLTPFVKVGGENVIAIRLDNPKDSSRWYPGGGIYRNVWLTKTAPVYVGQWGVQVTTSDVNKEASLVSVKVNLQNDSGSVAVVTVKNEIQELNHDGKNGAKIADMSFDEVALAPKTSGPLTARIRFGKPKLWSVENPNRYVVVTTVKKDGRVVDRLETPFGIRTIEFTATNGFLLNGERVQIRGVCNHHDLGALGSAFNTRAAERQLEILREMGVNAIRTSHNPPAPELLELCDRMGFLVMDETFDCWRGRKKPNDYHLAFDEWHEADVRALIRRDRNHPSVILWSIGNEIPEQANTNRFYIAKELADIVRSEDTTRPVTAGCNHDVAGFNGFQNIVDVFGFNYKPQLYGKFRTQNPTIPLYGSETASTVSSRGEYFFPVPLEFKTKNIRTEKSAGTNASLADFQVTSYDCFTPAWATTPDMEWRGQEENPFNAGEFVWTGFDYLGEPTPFNADVSNLLNYSTPEEKAKAKEELDRLGKIRVPSRSSYFGIVDLAGFKKDRFYLYQSRWRPDFPMAHILPHWNWPERVGQITPVFVYTSGDEAELFLNGKSLGRKKKAAFEYRLRWDDVKHAPGELQVVAYKNGKKWATDVVKTTGLAAKLMLLADRATIVADGKDLSFVTVTVADKKGQLVPRSKNQIKFEIEGPGEIVATDNGDPTSFESFQAPERKAFNGLALVIVRAIAGESGKIKLTAKAEGLASDSVTIRVK